MYKVGDIIVLTKDVENRARFYNEYFLGTKNIMPKGTKFKIVGLTDNPEKPIRTRLLINGKEILQTGGVMNSYSSLHSYEIRLESKTLALLNAIKDT